MVLLNRIYTKTGDKGTTGLGNGRRVPKHSLRIEALGAVDEANAAVGVARLHAKGAADAMLARIQNDLFDLGAGVCVPEDPAKDRVRLKAAESQVTRLEREIDAMTAKQKPLTSFVLPGGTALAAHLHVARAAVRRAERRLTALAEQETVDGEALRYINRLSDLLFVAARAANRGKDVLWQPGATR
ncbi:MAG: cob(I)yrinic acid a,c-diamide adenosyltransferase [Alphaproteobacteria bacterium]|nr:cob(I)yrinic acid a,c-diamide adenosyltransferase [Alphaproteobacteria bacterium]